MSDLTQHKDIKIETKYVPVTWRTIVVNKTSGFITLRYAPKQPNRNLS